MSEELKPCPICKGTNIRLYRTREDWTYRAECIDCRYSAKTAEIASDLWNELAALREENERLRNANPWRYPSRGELPETSGEYEVSLTLSWDDLLDAREFDETITGRCTGTRLYVIPAIGISFADPPPQWRKMNALDRWEVYAWRELPEPAPKLEDEWNWRFAITLNNEKFNSHEIVGIRAARSNKMTDYNWKSAKEINNRVHRNNAGYRAQIKGEWVDVEFVSSLDVETVLAHHPQLEFIGTSSEMLHPKTGRVFHERMNCFREVTK